jgi:hypothetical protein
MASKRKMPLDETLQLFETLTRIEHRLILIEHQLDAMERRADANGQQAATWTTPQSRAKAQKRPPQTGG